MISVGKIEIKYRCSNCANYFEVRRFGRLASVIDIVDELESPKKCTTCNNGMISAARISCDTINDIYGDEKDGVWRCMDRSHDTKKFYPIPIRSAHDPNDKFHSRDNWGVMANDYRKMAAGGFPWKCPTCGKLLMYELEKTLLSGSYYGC